jgi:hypothetical protein
MQGTGKKGLPSAPQPVAGICAAFEEETVRVEIQARPDNVPDPRCIRVRADQKLTISNRSGEPIEFHLGKFHAVIEPGGSNRIGFAFGDYLAPGAHSLHVEVFEGRTVSRADPSPFVDRDSREDFDAVPVGTTIAPDIRSGRRRSS